MSANDETSWTEVIRPKKKRLSINLIELFKYKDLIGLFVKRDFVSFYKQTVLGPFWYLLQPLIQTLVYSVMFGNIFSINEEIGIPSMLFFLSGTTTWWYFSQCVIKTSNTFTNNAHIFGKVYFPRLAVPVSVLLSNLIGWGIQFVMFVGFYFYYTGKGLVEFSMTLESLCLIPLLVINMAALGLGIGLVISSLTTKYKDFKQFIGFGIQLMMFASPVIVPMPIVYKKFPNWAQDILEYNPMTGVIEGFRAAFFNNYQFEIGDLTYSLSLAFLLLFFGVVIFNRTERNFMDTV